jgi:hypothetical protein
MYEKHPEITEPPLHAALWRYMDFAKFVDLLEAHSLYFCRVDRLGPFEGSFTKPLSDSYQQVYGQLFKDPNQAVESIRQFQSTNRAWPKWTYVNCWHMNDGESMAMWEAYIRSQAGIAVKTDFVSLSKSLTGAEPVFIGAITYLDYSREWFKGGNVLIPFFHKPKSYQHENEVRALIWKPPGSGVLAGEGEPGIKQEVDLATLLGEIYVVPNLTGKRDTWFRDTVQAVTKRYGIDLEVKQSTLDDEAVY